MSLALKLFSLLVAASQASASPAAQPRKPITDLLPPPVEVAGRTDAYLAPYILMKDFSGAVLIARGGRVLVRKGYGLADHELTVPASPEMAFGIGSVTKTFTAAAIVLLAERGQLSLSDPISKYLPGFPEAERITIAQVLGHESGLQDYFRFPEYAAHRTEMISLSEFVSLLRTKPLDFEPGTRSSYSGSGYKLLAFLIERVSGIKYEAFLARNVFQPLGMKRTGGLRDHQLVLGLAPGYDPGYPPTGLQPAARESMSWLVGNGGLFSTVDDLLRWAEAVRTEKVVHLSRLEYPFGWGKRTKFDREMIEQTGRIAIGYVSYLGIYPADDLVVVILSNIQAGLSDRVGEDLAAIALGKPYQSPTIRASTNGTSPTSSNGLGAFVGRYQMSADLILTVKELDEGLAVAGSDGAFLPLDAEGLDRFFFRPFYVWVTFERDAAGRVKTLNWGGNFRGARLE
jgi:CubicO group peptidase (beta-lactamase class C family)